MTQLRSLLKRQSAAAWYFAFHHVRITIEHLPQAADANALQLQALSQYFVNQLLHEHKERGGSNACFDTWSENLSEDGSDGDIDEDAWNV
jgi:hypothetical protein